MITHKDQNGKEIILNEIKDNRGIIKRFLCFVDEANGRLTIKHDSGKFIKLYSEYEITKAIDSIIEENKLKNENRIEEITYQKIIDILKTTKEKILDIK